MDNIEDYIIEKFEKELEFGFEYRYKILDKNNILVDDAQGYGFKTKQSAYKFLAYKLKRGDVKYQKLRKATNKLYKKYEQKLNIIQEDLEYLFFDSLKNNEDLSTKEVNIFLLKEIENKIPELFNVLDKDEKLSNLFLKKIR